VSIYDATIGEFQSKKVTPPTQEKGEMVFHDRYL
jgi:hypothetical protein